jgi:uncharacterized protein (TIGR01244 family)
MFNEWHRSRTASGQRLLVTGFVLTWLLAGQALAQSSLDLPNGKEPLEGIATAGQPNAEQFAAAAESGYKSVIDLRSASEDRGMDEKAAVEKLGMAYVNLPIEHAQGVTYANASALDELLSKLEGPVLIHCASGNRAGALLALRAKMHGADNDAALELGVSAGVTGLKRTVQEKLAAGHD